MSNEIVANPKSKDIEMSVIEKVVIQGDLSQLTPQQRVNYYRNVCESVGLNHFTNPLAYVSFQGKLTLYAKKDCTEQLRKIHGVSIEGLEGKIVDDLYIVKAKAKDKNGRCDESTGAVVIGHLKGDNKANAIMKAETKAKRRVTLSICGMGWADESEIDSIPGASLVDVDPSTGEIKQTIQVTPETTEVKKEVESQKISSDQVRYLSALLSGCDKQYRELIYQSIKKQFNADGLSGIPLEMFERIQSACKKNMEENQKKEIQVEAEPFSNEGQ